MKINLVFSGNMERDQLAGHQRLWLLRYDLCVAMLLITTLFCSVLFCFLWFFMRSNFGHHPYILGHHLDILSFKSFIRNLTQQNRQ